MVKLNAKNIFKGKSKSRVKKWEEFLSLAIKEVS